MRQCHTVFGLPPLFGLGSTISAKILFCSEFRRTLNALSLHTLQEDFKIDLNWLFKFVYLEIDILIINLPFYVDIFHFLY